MRRERHVILAAILPAIETRQLVTAVRKARKPACSCMGAGIIHRAGRPEVCPRLHMTSERADRILGSKALTLAYGFEAIEESEEDDA